jgi:hypothetical protein
LSSTLLNAWPAHASATALISSSGGFQGPGVISMPLYT